MSKDRFIKACPHCGELINIVIGEVELRTDVDTDKKADWFAALSDEQRNLINAAEHVGILHAVDLALKVARPEEDGWPGDIRKFFLNWLRCIRPKTIPYAHMQFLKSVLGNVTLGYQQANGVGVITANGKMRWIVPSIAVTGAGIKSNSGGHARAHIPADEDMFRDWIRTKRGYVAFDGAMLSQLRTGSIGELLPLSTNKLRPLQGGLIGSR